MKTQLLCTFAHRKDLDLIVDYVQKSYTISEKRLFVFSNADSPSELYVTYNVEPDDYGKTPNTIMIHRKKETNTLYTINAVNHIIKDANNGILDKSYRLQWNNYRNSILLTNKDGLNTIHTRLKEIIDLEK